MKEKEGNERERKGREGKGRKGKGGSNRKARECSYCVDRKNQRKPASLSLHSLGHAFYTFEQKKKPTYCTPPN